MHCGFLSVLSWSTVSFCPLLVELCSGVFLSFFCCHNQSASTWNLQFSHPLLLTASLWISFELGLCHDVQLYRVCSISFH
ncbi:hypothetical protein BJ508DRAFT_74113 [Ascobolus immersus RN42]|uniref:Uncharacterized protein n=1 Tax=Ascobolus immersus RN42 TaxID=1160509 RepID=A0A3N4HDQ1_ASCIM|nr:hypothetical protein BJ508DRAFT_74113 [Ascobolus immersus RN42]